MRKILLTIAVCVGMLSASAQTTSFWNRQTAPVEHWEWEVYLAGNYPFDKPYSDWGKRSMGWGLGTELRYNFDKQPIDVGVQASYNRVYADDGNGIWQVAATGDWNFARGCTVNPFAGVGIGFGFCEYITGLADTQTPFLFIPRVGVEVCDMMRATLAANISQPGYNNVQLSLGFVLGGGSRLRDFNSKFPEGKTPEYYNRRANRCLGMGCVLAGTGAVFTTVGIVGLTNIKGEDPVGAILCGASTVFGGLELLGSIPLFISYHHQHDKAMRLQAGISAMSVPTPTNGVTATPGVALTLNF